jgi:hypothetical protein
MGRNQAWLSRRLVFERFWDFIASGYKGAPNTERLTERAFRKLYSGTRGTEKERFTHVIAKLEDSLPVGHKHQHNRQRRPAPLRRRQVMFAIPARALITRASES